MKINFPETPYKKDYKLVYEDKLLIKNQEISNNKKELDISIGLQKNFLELYINSKSEKEKVEDIKDCLEQLNDIFINIDYELNNDGTVNKIKNYIEIFERWNKKIREMEITDKGINDILFVLTGIISNRKKTEELLKRFSIIPYICIGFQNQDLKPNIPLIKDGILYNIYGDEDIEVKYEIIDASITDGEKIVMLTGKDSSVFDRSSFVKKIHSSYPEVPIHQVGGFELKCLGKYIYSNNDILNSMEFVINLEIKNLLEYSLKFLLN